MKKHLMKLPLFIIVSVIFTSYLVLISGFIGYLSYKTSKNSVDKIAKSFINTTNKNIKSNINSFLELPNKINKLNSSLVLKNNTEFKDQNILEQQFISQIRTFESPSGIYLGNTDGGLILAGREDPQNLIYTINTDNFKAGSFKKYSLDLTNKKKELLLSLPDFDARTRPWYIKAIENNKESWSDIYILFTGDALSISNAKPVFNKEGKLLGVLSVELFLSKINNFLKHVDLGKNGEVFIVERSGLLVASSTDEIPVISDKGFNRRLYANESKEPFIKEVADKLNFKFNGLENIINEEILLFEINEAPVHTYVYPLKDYDGIDWIIAITIPNSDFMEDIWENNKKIIIVLVFASIVLVILSLFASAQVVRPVKRLNSSIKDIAKEKWKINNETYFIKEIDSLKSSFNTMSLQLSNAFAKLKIEVGERKSAENTMEKSLEEIKKINKKLENYSYTISHDLKEPIRSIRTFSQFISEDYTDKLDKDGQDYLKRIIMASTKMALMIDDILLLSKVGRIDIVFDKTEISAVIDEVKSLLQTSIEESNANIVMNNLPDIVCQDVWIKTVFQNLISNSIKYTKGKSPTIEISYQELKEFHEFAVRDNGNGIAEDQKDKIFGLFRKAHQDRTISGSGAGLAIATSVIEQHQGKIWVDWSEPGKGSIFKFTIKKNLV